MKKHRTFTVQHRRKREGKTDYRKRIKLLQSGKIRLVIRRSLREICAQMIQYNEKGDKIIVSAKSSELGKMGWNYNYRNTPSAYLLGLLIGKKAKDKGIREAVVDIGLHKSVHGSRIYAVIKGAADSGLVIPYSKSILPKDERIYGKHIVEYANNLKKNEEIFNKKFSGYLKNNIDPTIITKAFENIKNKLIGV